MFCWGKVLDLLKSLWARILCIVVWILFFLNVLMFVDWFKNVSTNFVYVYEIYATRVLGMTLN